MFMIQKNTNYFRPCVSLFRISALIFLNLFLRANLVYAQQANPSRILLQGFWWDFRNDNYKFQENPNGPSEPGRWYNYQAELAHRLATEIGIDAVWVQPGLKTDNVFSNGYNGFDHYDLGDKYQKSYARTKSGNKDEYLRMVGVMHANGIDVIQDVVLNHMDGAGSAILGAGGIDPASWVPAGTPPNQQDNYRWKNFRYTSYASPAKDESANDYLSRTGRFYKNWQNFHPNPAHNCDSGDKCAQLFGPDLCYFSGAIGQSSNAIYNPVQTNNWMYDNMAKWIVWYKKQTGFDGVRLDAVKHIEDGVVHGLMDELQSNAGWASGGQQMFAVGEWVGDAGQMDAWVAGEGDRAGTFDFNLRGAINAMATQNGFYNMSLIPGAQQNKRARTVPFVNNHDTFRPRRNIVSGKYEGFYDGFHDASIPEPDDYPLDSLKWEDNQELNPHIDPTNNKHIAGAYAIICALDGDPQIFFEDLFDIGTTGKGFAHDPSNAQQLPTRPAIKNIVKAHQVMGWKSKDANQNYLHGAIIRTDAAHNPFFNTLSASDVLIIERNSLAIIGVNDNEVTEGDVYVNCGFAVGTLLIDYSGQHPGIEEPVTFFNGSSRTRIRVPASDPTNGKLGYAIWAPKGLYDLNAPITPAKRSTTQEWEMSNDLGDSNPRSLKQGGALPDYGIWMNPRKVGRVFAEGQSTINVQVYPTTTGKFASDITVYVCNSDGSSCSTANGIGNITLNHTASTTDYYTINVANTQFNSKGQRVYVNATYTSPQTLNSALYNLFEPSSDETTAPEIAMTISPNPAVATAVIQFSVGSNSKVEISLYDYNEGFLSTIVRDEYQRGVYEREIDLTSLKPGIYIVKMIANEKIVNQRLVVTDK
jgi:alpha-amylase